jgi:hypothetical protein
MSNQSLQESKERLEEIRRFETDLNAALDRITALAWASAELAAGVDPRSAEHNDQLGVSLQVIAEVIAEGVEKAGDVSIKLFECHTATVQELVLKNAEIAYLSKEAGHAHRAEEACPRAFG